MLGEDIHPFAFVALGDDVTELFDDTPRWLTTFVFDNNLVALDDEGLGRFATSRSTGITSRPTTPDPTVLAVIVIAIAIVSVAIDGTNQRGML